MSGALKMMISWTADGRCLHNCHTDVTLGITYSVYECHKHGQYNTRHG